MLTVVLGRGAKWIEEVSRAACAPQTAPTSPGRGRSAAQMGRPTRTNAHCWRLNAKATLIWMCSTRESARVRHIVYAAPVTCQITQRCICQISISIVRVSVFPQTLQMSLSFQRPAATSCAPAAPLASWTKQITHTVWRVIGFAQRWRLLSSTCVETTGSSTPVRATWEEQPVSSADPSVWRMRENA